jgi:UDP-N-acetylglucosamine 2-epimerase (non-hydrolysing)
MSELKKIAFVLGTRPEAIKLSPLYLEFLKHRDAVSPVMWVTGQHRQMLDQVLTTFGITPDVDLDIMKPGQNLNEVTANVLQSLEPLLEREEPDLMIVQGDTTTVFAAALAAFYSKIPVAHVEAGLRTYKKYSPFPEEMNRQMVSRIADYHFAPTETAQKNLLGESVSKETVWVTGNTVIDALDIMVPKVRETMPSFPADFPVDSISSGRKMILITGHRRENFGAGFESICRAIKTLAEKYPTHDFVYPVHLNPNVLKPVNEMLAGIDNVYLLEPLAYEPFIWAMDQSFLLLTDSGGVQEEAPHLGKPVLVMREDTERPESITAGTSKLVGVDEETIVREVSTLLDDPERYAQMSRAINPYGDGTASRQIYDILFDTLVKPAN